MNIVDKARLLSVPEWPENGPDGPNGPETVRDPEPHEPEWEVKPAPPVLCLPHLAPEPPAWDAETSALIAWFKTADLPPEPFDLLPYARIVNPARFYRSQLIDIEAGPAGPRGRTGALRADLQRLKKLEEREDR